MKILQIFLITIIALGVLLGGIVMNREFADTNNTIVTQAENEDIVIPLLEDKEDETFTSIQVKPLSEMQKDEAATLRVSGVIESKHTSTVVAQSSGNVQNIDVRIGQKVSSGQKLVSLAGEADTQQLFLQQSNINENIYLQEEQIKITEQSLRENTQISLDSAKNSLGNIQNILSKTQDVNQRSIASLQRDLASLDEVILHTQNTLNLSELNVNSIKRLTEISASSSASSSVNTAWSLLQSSAIPLAELMGNSNGNRWEEDLEDLADDMDDWIGDIDSYNVKNDISSIANDIDEVIDDLQDFIETSANTSYGNDSQTAAQYESSILQGIGSLLQTRSALYSSIEQLSNLDNSSQLQIAPSDLQLLQLQQQRTSLQKQIETTEVQQYISEDQLQSQIIGAQGNIRSLEWTLSALQKNIQPEIQSLKRSLATLKQQQNEINIQVSKLTVTAPFDGIISDIFVEKGENITAGSALVEVITEGVIVKAFVNTSDIRHINIDQNAIISLFGENEKFNAQVISIYPTADKTTGNVTVELTVKDNFTAIPESLLDVEFDLSTNTAISNLVPINSINFEQDKSFIFIYNPENQTVSKNFITIGNNLGSFVEITEKFNPETLVVTKGQKFLEDGDKVSVN